MPTSIFSSQSEARSHFGHWLILVKALPSPDSCGQAGGFTESRETWKFVHQLLLRQLPFLGAGRGFGGGVVGVGSSARTPLAGPKVMELAA